MDAYFYIILVVGLLSSGVCLGAGILKKSPNDFTILSVAAVELALVVYLVGSIVRVIAGEPIAGEAWEFWDTWPRRCSCRRQPCTGPSWNGPAGATLSSPPSVSRPW